MGIPTAPEGHLNTKDHPAYSRGTQMAGDVKLLPTPSLQSYSQALSPAGYQNANPDAVAKGVMSGKVTIFPGK